MKNPSKDSKSGKIIMQVGKNIYQRGECSFQVKMMISGHKIDKTFDTLAEAETYRDLERGGAALDHSEGKIYEARVKKRESRSYTFSQLIEEYREKVTPKKDGADREISNLNLLARLPIAAKPVYGIKGEDIINMFEDIKSGSYRKIRENIKDKTVKPVTEGTVRRYSNTVRDMFEFAIKPLKKIERNPYDDLKDEDKPKNGEARKRRLIGDEYERILKHFEGKPIYQVAIIVFVETAMRQGEMLGMDWKNFKENADKKTGSIFLPKTKNGNSRLVPLSANALFALKSLAGYGSEEGRIFEGITANSIKHEWDDVRIALNIKNLRKHDLRHEATSRLVEDFGLNLAEVISITGHKTPALVNEVYYQANTEKLANKISGGKQKSEQDPYLKIEKLGELLQKGFITKAEFNSEKKKLLS